LLISEIKLEPGMVAHTYKPSTPEAEAERGSPVPGHPELHMKEDLSQKNEKKMGKRIKLGS
jgi:hypothetical protein